MEIRSGAEVPSTMPVRLTMEPADVEGHLPPSAPTSMEQHLEAAQSSLMGLPSSLGPPGWQQGPGLPPSQVDVNFLKAPLLLPFPIRIVLVAVRLECTLS